jgi:hypothetical protein
VNHECLCIFTYLVALLAHPGEPGECGNGECPGESPDCVLRHPIQYAHHGTARRAATTSSTARPGVSFQTAVAGSLAA